MKRIVKAALLTCVSAALPTAMFAQAAAAPAAGGQCQLAGDEFQVYNNATTQTDPKAKAAALEAYLTQYPNSCAKEGTLVSLITVYGGANDIPHAISSADRVLQLDPTNPQAIFYEAFLHNVAAGAAATAVNDPDPKKQAAAKQPDLDAGASAAQKGLALPKPANMSDADFTTYKETAYPTFYSVIGADDLNKNDNAGAIDTYKKELAFVAGDPKLAPQLSAVGSVLQDTFYLGEAYRQSTPPDYLDCAFYDARFVAIAPDPYKTQFAPNAKYCYRQYHGKDDGYDQLAQLAQANVTPPANLATTITPAPTPAEIIADILKTTTPDQLATSDKEYILQKGSADQAQTIWASMKGKALQFPDVLVIASTPQQVQVAATDNAKATKTADFTFNMAAPEELPEKATPLQKKAYDKKQADIAAAIAPGQTVTLSGTFDSYTPSPFMITMTDGAVVLPEAKKTTPGAVHHTAPHKAE